MTAAWVTALVGVGTAAITLITVFATRRKLDAEGTQIITATAITLIEPLRERVTALEAHVAQMEADKAKDRLRINRLERWAKALVAQVVELGGTPIPFSQVPDN